VLLVFSRCCFFFRSIVLLIVLFSHVVAFFFALLFSSLCCCSPFSLTTLLFTLLGVPLCTIAFFRLFFYFRYKVLHDAILLFTLLCCCYWCVFIRWRILYYPFAFFPARIGNGQELRIKNLYFFNKYFSLCLFPFLNF
jgi:hypothetical protein